MPPLVGFSDNPFKTRADVRRAILALLESLCKYQSLGGSRIQIPVSTGAHFDETAAQLEGFARPLWAVGVLLTDEDTGEDNVQELTQRFIRGLANGTNPEHPEYWGPVVVRDQRMVEMEIISFALLAAPNSFFHGQTQKAKADITAWLGTINGKDMPATNWLWFRVLTNLALIKVCGVPSEQLQPLMEDDLKLLDSFYLADGWASDGLWSEYGRQADYYSGSFAIQFSQLMYVKFAEDMDPERCKIYRERAFLFSKDFYHYFDQAGAAIPFGRSLTYRFAFAGFWSAAAYAEVQLSHPVKSLAAIKRLLLQHFRWWSSKHDIFNIDGTLNIGFSYPNMYMCEDYNSQQSVYWCMKSFCALGLSKKHPFWTTEEHSLPSDSISLSKVIKPPMHIACNTGLHHFMLSSGQFCPWPLKATEAKYGKFAYSSHFGFSVPTGPLLPQIAPDSTLALRICNDDNWKVRWISTEAKFATATLVAQGTTETIPVLVSSWKPWQLFNVIVRTALIAPSTFWPNWYIRVHRISMGSEKSCLGVDTVEGGFAICGRRISDGLPIQAADPLNFSCRRNSIKQLEESSTDSEGCLVCSVDGASGIRKLQPRFGEPQHVLISSTTEGSLLKPDANTNLMRQRTVIPTLKSTIPSNDGGTSKVIFLASAVFAIATQQHNTIDLWKDVPALHLGDCKDLEDKAYIKFNEW